MGRTRIRLGIFARTPNSIESGLLETLGYSPKTESVSSTYIEAPEELGDTCLQELRQFFPTAIIIKDEKTSNHSGSTS